MKLSKVSALAIGAVLLAGAALAAGYTTNGLPVAGGPQYPNTLPLSGKETSAFDTNLTVPCVVGTQTGTTVKGTCTGTPATVAISSGQLAQLGNSGPYSAGVANAILVAGDAALNTYPYGTSGVSATTTLKYQNSNWFAWSGTNEAVTVAKDTTAADLGTGFSTAYKVAITSGQTGTSSAVCYAQEVLSQLATPLANHTVEFNFWAVAGANFPSTNTLTAYISYGTGTDEGSSKYGSSLH